MAALLMTVFLPVMGVLVLADFPFHRRRSI
jgi:hypothetical protein